MGPPQHRVDAIGQDDNIGFQDIVTGLDSGDLITFADQSIDAHTGDELHASLFRFFH